MLLGEMFYLGILLLVCNVLGNQISIAPSIPEVSHFINDTHIVFCQSPLKTHWKSPGGFVVGATAGRIHIEEKSGQLALVFQRIHMNDRGKWTCETKGGEYKESFVLLVNEKLSFNVSDLVQCASEGMDTIVKCRPRGDPIPSISSWYRNGAAIKYPHERYMQVSNGILIKDLTKDDAGIYICRAFQVSETVTDIKEQKITLKIHFKPEWTFNNSPTIRYGYMNGEVNISCEVSSEPPAIFTWSQRNEVLLDWKDNSNYYSIIEEINKSIIQIKLKDILQFDDYICKAENPLGHLERTVMLREGEKPNVPTYINLRDVDSTSIELEIDPTYRIQTNLMDVFGYVVEYVPDFKNESTENEFQSEYKKRMEYYLSSNKQIELTELLENTTYVARIASQNIAGRSDWSEIITFTTLSMSIKLTINNLLLITAVIILLNYK